MRKIVMTYGLIAGAVLAAVLLVSMPLQDRIGFDHGAIVGYTSMVVAFLMVYFGVRSYRDQLAGGPLGFGRALAVGLGITVVASLCYVLAWQLVYHLLMPDFMDKYAAYALAKARQAGASEAQLAAQARELADFKVLYANPLWNMAITFLEPLPVGLLFSLVSAAVLRRPAPR